MDDLSTPTAAESPASGCRTTRGNRKAVPKGSTLACAGSNFYGSSAPFGTSVQRFSPSMSMAHHIPTHRPEFTGFARGSDRQQRSVPNRQWLPAGLHPEATDGHGDQARNPSSDTKDGRPGSAASSCTSARGGPQQPGSRPRSARGARTALEDQKLGRDLRREITSLREEKLRLRREGGPPNAGVGGQPSTACAGARPSPVTVVGLDDPEGKAALGRILGIHTAASGGRENRPPAGEEREISMEYASLLEFVAGESRRR